MPVFPGKLCLTLTQYIRSALRLMSYTTYWEPVDAFTGTTLQTAADDAQTNLGTLVAALLPDQAVVAGTHAVFEADPTYIDRYSTVGEITGSAAVVVLEDPGSRIIPDQDAVIIQRRTDVHGRDARGRLFIPGLWEGFNNEGQLDTAGQAVAHNIAAFLGADQTFGGVLCHARHWSRKQNDLLVITECRAMLDLGSRRDRQPRGPHLPIAA